MHEEENRHRDTREGAARKAAVWLSAGALAGAASFIGARTVKGIGGAGPGGGDGDSGPSTPFVGVWTADGYHVENDILLGFPATFFHDRDAGAAAYEAGDISHDLYQLRHTPEEVDGAVHLVVRELEPEESYLDYVALSRITHPAGTQLVVDGSHTFFHAFSNDEVCAGAGIATQHVQVRGADKTAQLGDMSQLKMEEGLSEETLQYGESVTVSGTVSNPATTPYVYLRSRFRDWTAGPVPALESSRADAYPSFATVNLATASGMARGVVAVVFSLLVWTGVLSGGADSRRLEQGAASSASIADAFGAPAANVAHASDGGHSLVVYHWNWQQEQYDLTHIIQPRYQYAEGEAIRLPAEAIATDGSVHIEIIASSRHTVSVVSLFAPEYDGAVTETEISLAAAQHVDGDGERQPCTTVLTERNNGAYTHLVPGEQVELAFDTTNVAPAEQQAVYAVRAGGFYTSLTREGEMRAGDWVNKLDRSSRDMLSGLYALKDYGRTGAEPVLKTVSET